MANFDMRDRPTMYCESREADVINQRNDQTDLGIDIEHDRLVVGSL